MTHSNRSATRTGPQALSAAISAVLSVAGGNAAAQEQEGAPEIAGLGEVIVTATKRAERLQDVSESISAFDSSASRCAACSRSTTSRSTSPGCPSRSASRAARPSCSAASRAPASSSAPFPLRRSTSTSNRSRRAGAVPTRASSTSSASRRCAGRRARCTARARSPARCASSRPSPIPPASTPGPKRR